MATTAKTPITQEVALSILTRMAKNKINTVGVGVKNTQVSSIGYTNADGEPFTYPSGDEYAVVNFVAVNAHQLAEAVEHYKAGRYNEAVNTNMSMRMSVADAQQIRAKVSGTLTCHLVDLKDDNGIPTGEQAIMPLVFVPNASVDAVSVDFLSLLAETEVPALEI